jgi:hypothetical protein
MRADKIIKNAVISFFLVPVYFCLCAFSPGPN